MRFYFLLFIIGIISPVLTNGQSADALHHRIFDTRNMRFGMPEWKFASGGKIFSSPHFSDGKIFFGSGDSCIYALDSRSGEQKWRFKTNGAVHSSPVVHEGKMYAGSFDGNYYCLASESGREIWRFKTSGERWPGGKGYFGWKPDSLQMDDPWDYFLSSPVVANGIIYFGSGDSHVYAIDAESGSLVWKYKTDGIVHTTPAVSEGILFIGSWDTYLYALEASSGKLLWKFKTGENPGMTGIQSSPMISNNSVYFGARDANLYCLNAKSGTLRWKYAAENAWILSTPVYDGGNVYVGTSDSYLLLALNANSGKEVWRSKLNGYVFGSPCVSKNAIFIGDFTGRVYSINKNDGKTIEIFETDSFKKEHKKVLTLQGAMDFMKLGEGKDFSLYSSTVEVMDKLYSLGPIVSSGLISDDILYIGSANGTMYAISLRH
jgi:eukaryotic-like serine/threonine-protein kinase